MQTKTLKIALVFGVVSILVLSGSFFAFPANSNEKGSTSGPVSSSLPASLSGASFASITLYNNQSQATPSPFQQELIVNSNLFSSLENANLSNVEFVYLTGQIIPSWLESGNSNISTESVYWLNLTGMAANSQLSIYIVFLPLNKIAFNGVNVGEAAQLSGNYGTPSYGIYNDIGAVMSPGLIYQYYVPTNTAFSYGAGIMNMETTNLTPLSYLSGSSNLLRAITSPFNTNLSGNAQYVWDRNTVNNVIINLRGYGYGGGTFVPNPPVSSPTLQFFIKAIGWINVPNSGTQVTVLVDDGIILGNSTTGGLPSGFMWSSADNTMNHWVSEGATPYSSQLNTGTQRIQLGYENTGGDALLAMYTSSAVSYYHAALPPNGVEPGVSISHTILNSLYSTTVSSTGLPASLNWTLSINGIASITLPGSSSLTLNLPNGTYSYTATSNNNTYKAASNKSGSFTIAASSFSLNVQFTEVTYTITFSQVPTSLIQTGVTWFVNLSGAQSLSFSSTANNTTVQLHNGTYRVSYGTDMPSKYQTEDTTITVAGAPLYLPVNFQKAFPVYLNETGLPSGTMWFVNTTYFGSYSSDTPYMMLYSINGSYSYTVNTVNKTWYSPGGSYTVNGAYANESIVFTQVLYEITLMPTGYTIPANITWYADSTNGAFHASGTGMNQTTVNLTNGTYGYKLHTSTGSIDGVAGTFNVSGASTTVYIGFYLVTYRVNFTETGLPSNTYWYVNTFNGTTTSISTTDTYMAYDFANGSFNYTVGCDNSSFVPVVRSDQITVAGSDITVSIVFIPATYEVNFTAKGLPSGTAWYLYNGAMNASTSGKMIGMELQNGTYKFSVATSDSAYSPFLSVIMVRVQGASVNFDVLFYQKTSSVTFTVENLPASVGTWYLNITGGPSVVVQGQSVSLNLAYGNYSYTIAIAGSGTVYSGNIAVGPTPLNVYVNITTTSGSAITGAVPYSFGSTALYNSAGMTWLQEVTQ